jgi:cell division septation protein DedD
MFTTSQNSKMNILVSSRLSMRPRVSEESHANETVNRWKEKYVMAPTTRPPALSVLTNCTVLQRVAGKDASKQFWKYHNEGILKKYKGQLQIGSLDTKKQPEPAPAPAPAPKKAEPTPQPQASGDFKPPATAEPLDVYGDLIPFADPSWYQGVS